MTAEDTSPAAGACVLVLLGGGATAAVFAASTEAGVLAVWGVGVTALWMSVRRHKGTDLALPSPTVAPSRGNVSARETGEVARVVTGPGGVMLIHMVREEVPEP